MTMRAMTSILAIILLSILAGCDNTASNTEKPISGHIEQGLRVLVIDPAVQDQAFYIYRGDYVKPQLASGATFQLKIPGLKVDLSFPRPLGEKPYFKASELGVFAFEAGDVTGTIEVVEYQAASFRDVTADEGKVFIAEKDPLILDVRTKREFDGGHLEGAVLLPVQVLQRRIGELSAHKDRPVFVYCRTGNRSTVASKLLVDAGHQEIVNLKRGIVDWERRGMKVVR